MIIILTTLSLILGILAGHYLQLSPATGFLFTGVSTLCFLLAFYKSNKNFIQKPYFASCTFLMAFSVGMISFSLHHEPNQKLHYSHLPHNETQTIEGTISERLKPNNYNEKYILKVRSINRSPASGKILVNLPLKGKIKQLQAGDKIIVSDTPSTLPKPLNPYDFDYSAYMAKQNIFHQLTLKENYIIAGQIKNIDFYTEAFRNKLLDSFSIHKYDKSTTGIINALLLGQRQDMNKEISESYTDAGVVHILAISGLHIAILFYILTILLKPLRRLNNKGKLLQFILILGFLWTFAVLTGLSASVVRSVVMFSFITTGIYINRNASIHTSIAISMLVLLIINPNWIFDAGFQLSYLAVIAIVTLYPLYKKIHISKYRIINHIADAAAISLIAQIGVLPLSLYYFNQFPLLFLIANSIVIPLSNVVLILGISVLMLNFIYKDGPLLLGKALELLIDAMNTFIAYISSFERFIIKDIPFSFTLNIALYVIIVCGTLWLYQKNYKTTIALLSSILLFQGLYTIIKWQGFNTRELIVFHNSHNSMIAAKNNHEITVYSTDSLALEHNTIKAYRKACFNPDIAIRPLKNVLWFEKEKLFIIDSMALYNVVDIDPDIIILTQSPKINLERVLAKLNPKQVIADATNYKSLIQQWKASCAKQKISFHATAEKGYYRID